MEFRQAVVPILIPDRTLRVYGLTFDDVARRGFEKAMHHALALGASFDLLEGAGEWRRRPDLGGGSWQTAIFAQLPADLSLPEPEIHLGS